LRIQRRSITIQESIVTIIVIFYQSQRTTAEKNIITSYVIIVLDYNELDNKRADDMYVKTCNPRCIDD
jgi:hypothetical protein